MADLGLTPSSKPRSPVRGIVTAVVLVGLIAMPALLAMRGCDEKTASNIQPVKLGSKGKKFYLEIADTDQVRMKGLGGRDHIEDTGGMLFVFNQAHKSAFVMRDCPIDIDIIYLDPNGRIMTMYQMKKEPPRGPDEGEAGTFTNQKYEDRLVKYDSKFPMQFAIELKGGTLPSLNLREGDKVDLPVAELKKRAK